MTAFDRHFGKMQYGSKDEKGTEEIDGLQSTILSHLVQQTMREFENQELIFTVEFTLLLLESTSSDRLNC